MKPHLTVLCFLLICAFSSCKKDDVNNGQTYVLLPATLPEGLRSVYFIDNNNGFVGGDNGGIYKTTNGGQSWKNLTSNTTYPIDGLFFINDDTGFAVGGQNSCSGTGCAPPGGFILRTTNGGQNWTKIYTPSNRLEVTSVYFVNSSTGFCTCGNLILKTTNSGQTWTEYPIDNLGGLMQQITFSDSKNGFATALFDKIVKTSDGGNSWQISSPQFNVGYYSVSAANGAVYVSGQGKIIKSTDNGGTWTILANSPTNIFSLYFLNAKKGIATGVGNYSGGDFGHSYAAVYTTSDGGESWTGSSDIQDFGMIRSISFPGHGSTGYGISGNKVIRLSLN